MGLTLRMCLCASPMVRKSCDKGHTKETVWLWMDGWSYSLQVKIKWGRVLLPPHDQRPRPVLFLTIRFLCNCNGSLHMASLSCLLGVSRLFKMRILVSLLWEFPSVILFSVIYLCESPLSKGHTEGLEVRPACIFKNTVHFCNSNILVF